MANPVVTAITQGVVTKIATNVIEYMVHNLSQGVMYYYTFRDTGVAASATARGWLTTL